MKMHTEKNDSREIHGVFHRTLDSGLGTLSRVNQGGGGGSYSPYGHELFDISNGLGNQDDVDLYVDTVVDPKVEPADHMQPHVIIRPRKNIIQDLLPKHPSQAVKKYELGRIKRVQENKAKFDELGLGKYGTDPNTPTVQNQKEKDKVSSDDEYVLESEQESDDSSNVI
ncbi:hypothetical protein OROHE_008422 [Orobanche hederae]